MTVTIDEDTAKISTKLGELERHAKECSEAVVDDTFVLGRFMDKFTKEDLDKLYSATGKFYNDCICTRKSLFERSNK